MMCSTMKIFLAGLTAVLVVGCGGESKIDLSGEGSVGVQLPGQLRRIAALDSDSLNLEVTVNDNDPVRVSNQPGDVWEARVGVPVDQANDIKVEWSTIVSNEKVLLADFTTQVGASQETLVVSDSSYSSSGSRFNIDNDPFSNLQEVDENRNPLDRIDLVIPRSNATFLSPSIGVRELEDPEVSNEIVGNETAESKFAVWHDDTQLKFLMCIQDSAIFNDGSNADAPNNEYWHDDAIEIYIDAGNDATAGSPFDTANDFQFVYSPEVGQSGQYTNDVRLSNNSGARPICPNGSCSSHSFNSRAGCGYELAVQFDLAALGLSAGSEFGLDVEILDDDSGGLRERKYAWIGSTNDSFIFPFSFGKVRLDGGTGTSTGDGE